MSHVIPDLIQKIVKGQNPLHILGDGNQIRHYTYAGDLANGIVATLENDKAENEMFNISTPTGHTVIELSKIIWKKIKGDEEFKGFVNDRVMKSLKVLLMISHFIMMFKKEFQMFLKQKTYLE